MGNDMILNQPLPLNFPQDFLPDRSLLSRLLAFVAETGVGDKQAISKATGIPTGKSTGKVEPMIRYAIGMGLIRSEKTRGVWRLALSTAGALVVEEDPYLEELPTQWFCHLMLCRRVTGNQAATGIAEPWFALFAEGESRLGNPFTRDSFLESLAERHGKKSYLRSLSGLVPRTYMESICLGALGVLKREQIDKQEAYRRLPAPNKQVLYPAYAAFLFVTWDTLFPDRPQMLFDELLSTSRLLAILFWRSSNTDDWTHWMRARGLLQLDNLTGATMALRLADTAAVIEKLYSEMD